MSNILKVLFVCLFCLNSFANENYIDSLTLQKVKKLIQKEEQIAIAYKNYLIKEGKNPANIAALKTAKYLPAGFDVINPFGKEIKFDATTPYKLESSIPDNLELRTNLFDYYYSNTNRINTKSPLSIKNNKIEIIFSQKEKFIYDNKANITKTVPANGYYLDEKGVLHWYENSVYKFSIDKDLIVDETVGMLDSNGNLTASFKTMMTNKNIMYSGQKIVQKNKDTGSIEEFVNIGDNLGVVKINSKSRDIGKTIIQFTRRAGGMIVNGDIYTWGNNANKITGININSYTKEDGTAGSRYPVITGLVQARAKVYDDNLTDGKDLTEFTSKGYFSSPSRPKFVDFFSTAFHSTCGVSTKGELYCGGTTGINFNFGTVFTHIDATRNGEMLYRSTFFDGKTNKAAKIFANNELWLILSQDGNIYRWGYDRSGFSGNGALYYNYTWTNTSLNPEKLTVNDAGSSVKFSDITYLLTIDYRKMGALSTSGDIYIWGVEPKIAAGVCGVSWEGVSYNLCSPTKVSSTTSTIPANVSFESIQGGLESFVAKSTEGKFYKIHQPKEKKIQVVNLNDAIKTYNQSANNKYIAGDDDTILSVDISSTLGVTEANDWNKGIVWVNGKNELKGDYFTAQNAGDNMFKDAIKKIKWKQIKVIQDDNGMCGIDIYNQMYCWGIMSFYRLDNNHPGNTFMIPVFNTNLYDEDKDYLVAEGASVAYLTNITSKSWSTTDSKGNAGAFFMKYPTYIGGFNYEFIFN